MKRKTFGNILCAICKDPKRPITLGERQAEEIQKTKKGLAHSDCYFEKIGELIDRRPIASARVRRG